MSGVAIYYFSGTGNTLYLAQELQKRLPGATLTPIISLLSQQTIVPEHKTIGLCFPNYAGHLPLPMKQLLRKLKLKGDEYVFAVVSSASSRCHADRYIDRELAKSGNRLKAMFNIFMPNNHPNHIGFSPPRQEDIEKAIIAAIEKLDVIADIVIRQEERGYVDDAPNPFPLWMQRTFIPMVLFLAEKHPILINKGYLYSTPSCTGCRICELVCPASRIAVTQGRPQWDIKVPCFACTACLNFCPTEAVQVASTWFSGTSCTKEKGRYPHPFASADDIARQKVQQ